MTTLLRSPDTAILALLCDRAYVTAAAIGEACKMKPGEVRARLAGLESRRLVAGRQDTRLVPPTRTFFITREGRRQIGPSRSGSDRMEPSSPRPVQTQPPSHSG